MQIHTGVHWSVGVGHKINQDSLVLQHVALQKGECLLAIVCDGIGSMELSQKAGKIAVSHMTDWFYHEGKELIFQNKSKEIILLALQHQIGQIQKSLLYFQQNHNIITGTTCSGLLIVKNRYYLIHIGDSRIYQIRKNKIPFSKIKYRTRCLTVDDTDANRGLHKCLGASGTDRAVLETGRVSSDSIFLLCTDGFYGKLDKGNGREGKAGRNATKGNAAKEDTMGKVLGPLLEQERRQDEAQIERRLELLAERARQSGSRDDMSAVCIVV